MYILNINYLLLCISITVGSILGDIIDGDYCMTERFQPSCNADEVIVMTSALYGRMELGRCVNVDLGFLGCQDDVLRDTDIMCSGRQSCEIWVANLVFDQKNVCYHELSRYLSASYECVKVEIADNQQCLHSPYIQPSSETSGFLASHVTVDTNKGSPSCPWLIEGEKGQRVNITLYDFTLTDDNAGCHVYAVIREKDKSTSQVICGGQGDRIKNIYVSESHSVQIAIRVNDVLSDQPNFLLEYEVSAAVTVHIVHFMSFITAAAAALLTHYNTAQIPHC